MEKAARPLEGVNLSNPLTTLHNPAQSVSDHEHAKPAKDALELDPGQGDAARGSAPETGSGSDLNWLYLTSELARIDACIQRQVSMFQLAGQDAGDDLRGLYFSDQQIADLLRRPFASNWAQSQDRITSDQGFQDLLRGHRQRSLKIAQQAQAQKIPLRLQHLAQAFDLDAFEIDCLLICLAPVFDLRYEKIYGYLQDDVTRRRPTVNLILDLLCQDSQERFQRWAHFSSQAPLFRHQILGKTSDSSSAPLLSQAIYPENRVSSWLLGHDEPQFELQAYLDFSRPNMVSGPVLESDEIFAIDAGTLQEQPVLVFYGADRARQDINAAQIARQLDQPLLELRVDALLEDGVSLPQALRWALRDARLDHAVLYFSGWDACLASNHAPPAALLREICAHPQLVILGGRSRWYAKGFSRQRKFLYFETNLPGYALRAQLWRNALRSHPAQAGINLIALAGQFQLSTGQIRDACASARDAASQSGKPVSNQHLFAAARAHSNPNLSNLARKIQARYTWSDLILPPDQLRILQEITATVFGRPLVLDEWGIGAKLAASRGVTVLFAGPPGTGKTMAAEVISAELGLDLYKIDLSTVISKYIGETEKNLERIFAEAETSNAILFFDEADALFGKRSEVRDSHDRYANIEISYLLQRMEAYDGVTILATNLRANLDEAFKRRLQFAVDFPFPEGGERLRIWQTLFPPQAPRGADIDLELMAQRFKLAGGNIRNILVSAAYLAAADGGEITMAHLLHGARRELQKMGRLVDEPGLFNA